MIRNHTTLVRHLPLPSSLLSYQKYTTSCLHNVVGKSVTICYPWKRLTSRNFHRSNFGILRAPDNNQGATSKSKAYPNVQNEFKEHVGRDFPKSFGRHQQQKDFSPLVSSKPKISAVAASPFLSRYKNRVSFSFKSIPMVGVLFCGLLAIPSALISTQLIGVDLSHFSEEDLMNVFTLTKTQITLSSLYLTMFGSIHVGLGLGAFGVKELKVSPSDKHTSIDETLNQLNNSNDNKTKTEIVTSSGPKFTLESPIGFARSLIALICGAVAFLALCIPPGTAGIVICIAMIGVLVLDFITTYMCLAPFYFFAFKLLLTILTLGPTLFASYYYAGYSSFIISEKKNKSKPMVPEPRKSHIIPNSR